jgi:hypothetical protein
MKTASLLALLALSRIVCAAEPSLPKEVKRFLDERKTCDHFRSEPIEGDMPGMKERREYVIDSMYIYCSGTDKRLATLKKRYGEHSKAMRLLNRLDEKIEPH